MAYSLCGTSVDNTGEQNCDKSRGVARKLFIYNGTLDADDIVDSDTFVAALVAKSKLSKDDAEKVFVIPEIQDIADASEANKTGSLNLGFSTVLLEGKPAYNLKLFAGSDLLKRLRTFNNQSIRLVEFDANGNFWVYSVGTGARGFNSKVFFTGNKMATGQNVEEGVVNVSLSILSTSEYIDAAKWVPIGDGNVEDIEALIDVNLTEISNVGNVYKIGLEIPGSNLTGAYNIYDTYGVEIAALTFTAGTGVNYGTPLAITSVAVDAALKALTVTFDSTAYTALPANTPIRLVGPAISALQTAGVTETELISVIVTK